MGDGAFVATNTISASSISVCKLLIEEVCMPSSCASKNALSWINPDYDYRAMTTGLWLSDYGYRTMATRLLHPATVNYWITFL